MGLECRLVFIHLVQPHQIGVAGVLNYIEAKAVGLVPHHAGHGDARRTLQMFYAVWVVIGSNVTFGPMLLPGPILSRPSTSGRTHIGIHRFNRLLEGDRAMPVRTGAEYIAGLRENQPEVYLNGERVVTCPG